MEKKMHLIHQLKRNSGDLHNSITIKWILGHEDLEWCRALVVIVMNLI
jgi:hypothetical protein